MICDGCTHAECCPAKEEHGGAKRCSAFKPQEMTNEEYLKSIDTEQLAEELLAWWFDGANTYSQFGLFKWEIDEAKEKITEWLKQPHTTKE